MAVRRRKTAPGWENREIFAIGHSTRSAEDVIELLEAHGVKLLADIRTVPRSRTNPQFNSDAFAASLRSAGIDYVHLAALGGLRRPRKDSRNTGWRNESFRGYADYMGTEEFAAGLQALRELSERRPTALMCAEALRWRCHRSLTADALFARGVVVRHIESRTRARDHVPTPFVRIRGLDVSYPASLAQSAAPRRCG